VERTPQLVCPLLKIAPSPISKDGVGGQLWVATSGGRLAPPRWHEDGVARDRDRRIGRRGQRVPLDHDAGLSVESHQHAVIERREDEEIV
jgi:hypothetical protein